MSRINVSGAKSILKCVMENQNMKEGKAKGPAEVPQKPQPVPASACSKPVWKKKKKNTTNQANKKGKKILSIWSESQKYKHQTVFTQSPPLKVWGSVQKRRWKDSKSLNCHMAPDSSRHNRTDALMTHSDSDNIVRLSQVLARGVPALRWGSGHGIPPWTKKLSVIDTPLKRENLFSSVNSPWIY